MREPRPALPNGKAGAGRKIPFNHPLEEMLITFPRRVNRLSGLSLLRAAFATIVIIAYRKEKVNQNRNGGITIMPTFISSSRVSGFFYYFQACRLKDVKERCDSSASFRINQAKPAFYFSFMFVIYNIVA